MTEAPSPGAPLDAIIARNRWLLLDFDGPICSIYAGLPAPTVADQLRKLLTGQPVRKTWLSPTTRWKSSPTQAPSAPTWPPGSKQK